MKASFQERTQESGAGRTRKGQVTELCSRPLRSRHFEIIREIKIHVYGIRQTANVSSKFLRIENKQIKTVQKDSCGQNWHKTTYFCVEAINIKRKTKGKLGHVVQIHVCRLA